MTARTWQHQPFAEWVRDELRLRNWKASDFARRLDLSSGTVSRWLTGARQPDPESCAQIADALGTDLDRVLALVGHRAPRASDPPPDDIGTIYSLLRRIRPTPDRLTGVKGMLLMWMEIDRAAGYEHERETDHDDSLMGERQLASDLFAQFLDVTDDPDPAESQKVFDEFLRDHG